MKRYIPILIILILLGCLGFSFCDSLRLSGKLEDTEAELQSTKQQLQELELQSSQPEPDRTQDESRLPGILKLQVDRISQFPELRNGCEITSATMALNYLGFDTNKLEMADRFLPKGEPYWEVDPEEKYMGDPRGDQGWYCLTGPIEEAVNNYFKAYKVTDYYAEDITGVSVQELKELLASGHPVIFWATVNFNPISYRYEFKLPDGSFPYTRLHCMLLTGYDSEKFYLADPLEISESVEFERFEPIFEGLGRRAVVIKEK